MKKKKNYQKIFFEKFTKNITDTDALISTFSKFNAMNFIDQYKN